MAGLIKNSVGLFVTLTLFAVTGEAAIFVYEGRHFEPPSVTATLDGQTVELEPYGQCISGKKCYDVLDSKKYFMKRYIFVSDIQMEHLKINGHAVDPELDGVYHHTKGLAIPVKQFLAEDMKSYRSFNIKFIADEKPKKEFRLVYEFAKSVKLGSSEMRLSTGEMPTAELGMTHIGSDSDDLLYGCRPAIYPGHLLTKLFVYDGDELVFESTVSRLHPPEDIELVEESQSIHYLDEMGSRSYDDEDATFHQSDELRDSYRVVLLFPITDYTKKSLRCIVDGRPFVARTGGLPLDMLLSDSRAYVFYWKLQPSRDGTPQDLEVEVMDQYDNVVQQLTLSHGGGRYIFDQNGELFSFTQV